MSVFDLFACPPARVDSVEIVIEADDAGTGGRINFKIVSDGVTQESRNGDLMTEVPQNMKIHAEQLAGYVLGRARGVLP